MGQLMSPRKGHRFVFKLSSEKTTRLEWLPSGGMLLDKATNTIAYTEQSALKFLRDASFYPRNTQIILPQNTSIQLTSENQSITLSEVGAIMIGAGTYANVKVLSGHPIVITHDRKPDWYEKFAPDGIHRQMFNELSAINSKLYSGFVYEKAIHPDNLQKFLEAGILQKINAPFLRWGTFESEEAFVTALKELEISGDRLDKYLNLWISSKQKELSKHESGKFDENALAPDLLDKLRERGFIRKCFPKSKFCFWSKYPSNSIQEELSKENLSDEQKKAIDTLWRNTTRSGYDFSGLVWEHGKITVYTHQLKTNLWNSERSDWITNSSAYGSKSGCPIVGVSTVVSKKEYPEPTPFKIIRPEETLHHHPMEKNKRMAEVYFIVSGKLAMVSIQNNKPHIHIAKKGDIAMISPGMSHCIAAFSGDYEHFVLQIPSTFQYGYQFKVLDAYEKFGLKEKNVVSASLDALNKFD